MPSREQADRNRVASIGTPGQRSVSPSPSAQATRRFASTSSSAGGRTRETTPEPAIIPPAGVPSLATGSPTETTISNSSTSTAPSSYAAIPPRLTRDLLGEPSGMRTPMSVSSLNVETGSIAEGSTEGDDDRSVVTPIKDTPPASVLMGGRDTDVPDVDAEADADDRPVTPTSSIGGRLADVDLEDRTERELEAYEAETEDQPRQPEDVGAPVLDEPDAGAIEERIVPHVAETAHEAARERTVTPPPEPIDQSDSAAVEQAEDASLVATVPGNALAAMQPSPERTSRNQYQPLRESIRGPTSPLASSTSPTPVVSAVVPVPPEADVADQRPTPNATPHAEDVERLQSDSYGADDEALAVMTGSKPVPGAPADAIVVHEEEQPAADVLDSLMDGSPEPPADVPTSATSDDMPSVRCSDCSKLVPLMDLGEHTCEPAVAAQSPERRTASSTSTVQPAEPQSDDFVRQQDALVPEDVTAEDDPETPVAPVAPMPSPSHDVIDAYSQPHDDETDSPMDAQFPAPPSPRSRQDSAASIDGIPAPGASARLRLD